MKRVRPLNGQNTLYPLEARVLQVIDQDIKEEQRGVWFDTCVRRLKGMRLLTPEGKLTDRGRQALEEHHREAENSA